MTDLERVRDALRRLAVIGEHELAAAIMNIAQEAKEELDAHLKEDAEREDRLMDAYTAMDERDAELARLREERDKLHALYNRAQDDASREAGIRVEQGFELARLREENAALHLMAQRPDMDLFRENARLREELDLKDGLLNQAKGELARLRANQETDMSAVSECIEENIRLLAALRNLLDDTQHDEHHCTDPVCPVRIASAAISEVES